MSRESIRFGIVGTNHFHIHGQVACMTNAGAEFISFFEPDPALADDFARRYPAAQRVRSEQ